MDKLAGILDRFNRKERNLLIRDAAGQLPGKMLPLSTDFRERVQKALNQPKAFKDDLTIPEDAWWWTDYHLNWIAGALALWNSGDQEIGKDQHNDLPESLDPGLIEQNQEDADLLIAFKETLILVEVKAYGYFTNQQIDSKVSRWRLLKQHAELVIPKLTFHFMLMSRKNLSRLNPPPDDLLPARSEWPHAELKIYPPLPKLKVTGRKPGAKAPSPNGRSWFIVKAEPGSNKDEIGTS